MKFTISLDQRDYFRKNGFIPFKELLKTSEIEALTRALKKASLTKGRDLWRLNEDVKKVVFSKRLIELAYDILQKKPLRIAFDQLLESSQYEKQVTDFSTDLASLQDLSCISNLEGFFLISLKTSVQLELEAGDGYFILPSTSLSLLKLPDASHFFLIAFGSKFSQYLYEERDPQLHFLKSLGYVFGDKLNDRLHPILLR